MLYEGDFSFLFFTNNFKWNLYKKIKSKENIMRTLASQDFVIVLPPGLT